MISNTAAALINGTFGWAAIMAANLPSGGPAYPLATPGARLQYNPTEEISLLAAVFSGDPAGANCLDNPQVCNRYGTTFSFSGGAFWIGEVQYQINQDKDAKGLAAQYKIGAWYHSGNFSDQRFGLTASGAITALASLPAPDVPNRRGNWGIYGVADQMLWRGEASSFSVFTRAGVTPSDRNLVSWYVDAGVGFKGLIPQRADDTLTFAVAYSKISPDTAGFDLDSQILNGQLSPICDAETVFELAYSAQIAPWWTVQPDLQYIVHPGGNVFDLSTPPRRVGDAFVIGARTTITF